MNRADAGALERVRSPRRAGATVHRPPQFRSPERTSPEVPALLASIAPVLEALINRLAFFVAERLLPLLTPAPTSLVGVEEAAKLVDVPASWLAAEARRGTFRSYKRGHYRRYDSREVVEDFKQLRGREE